MKAKFAGLRPLVMNGNDNGNGGEDSKKIARTHVIEKTQSGMFSLMGGKWTTYRVMAEETMD
jgi:glycerol-3-phosphate dehydrogenase